MLPVVVESVAVYSQLRACVQDVLEMERLTILAGNLGAEHSLPEVKSEPH